MHTWLTTSQNKQHLQLRRRHLRVDEAISEKNKWLPCVCVCWRADILFKNHASTLKNNCFPTWPIFPPIVWLCKSVSGRQFDNIIPGIKSMSPVSLWRRDRWMVKKKKERQRAERQQRVYRGIDPKHKTENDSFCLISVCGYILIWFYIVKPLVSLHRMNILLDVFHLYCELILPVIFI